MGIRDISLDLVELCRQGFRALRAAEADLPKRQAALDQAAKALEALKLEIVAHRGALLDHVGALEADQARAVLRALADGEA
jgi:hypothetical protein